VLTGLTLTSRRWGWNLLLTRGLAAWIDARRSLEPQEQLSPLTVTHSPSTEPVKFPDPVQQQLTFVLADMIRSRISA